MTELRKRMIESRQLRGYSLRTQEGYLRAVRQLAEHDHKSPDLISEPELRDSVDPNLPEIEPESVASRHVP
jgi:hypothetical protein